MHPALQLDYSLSISMTGYTVLCKSNSESELRRNLTKLCDMSKEAKFRRYFDEKSMELLFRYYRNFVQMREISHGISFEILGNISCQGVKFPATFHLMGQNSSLRFWTLQFHDIFLSAFGKPYALYGSLLSLLLLPIIFLQASKTRLSLNGLGHTILGSFSTDRMVIELSKISK